SRDQLGKFDQCLDHFDSVMENDAMKEYNVFTTDCEFDQLEWEKASKFRGSNAYPPGEDFVFN
ncbi:hypothetical protein IRJ41_025899, partial [Triplophysa rosa]